MAGDNGPLAPLLNFAIHCLISKKCSTCTVVQKAPQSVFLLLILSGFIIVRLMRRTTDNDVFVQISKLIDSAQFFYPNFV